jgi:hypothetical protein
MPTTLQEAWDAAGQLARLAFCHRNREALAKLLETDITRARTADCLQCPDDAKRFATKRGLCDKCYRRSRKAVLEGKTSWAALEQAGQVMPAQQRRARGRWFGRPKPPQP